MDQIPMPPGGWLYSFNNLIWWGVVIILVVLVLKIISWTR